MTQKIPLAAWAAARYNPPPPLFTLRRWARAGEIQPAPERVGKSYYVLATAERVGVARPTYVPLTARI